MVWFSLDSSRLGSGMHKIGWELGWGLLHLVHSFRFALGTHESEEITIAWLWLAAFLFLGPVDEKNQFGG